MVGRKNLVAIGPDAADSDPQPIAEGSEVAAEAMPAEAASFEEDWIDDEPATSVGRLRWIAPAVAVVAVVGWTVFFGWVHQEAMLAGASPAQWTAWVVDWSVPVVLVVATNARHG